jgi:hypothetical protein
MSSAINFAEAQDFSTPNILPPPPPPPPSPPIYVPQVPTFDQPQAPMAAPSDQSSFGDRVVRCLDDAAGAGLSPNDRAAYSRSCANQ